MPETDTEQQPLQRAILNIGSLKSQIELKLHTYHAARIWTGRGPTDEQRGIPSTTLFLAITNLLKQLASRDDPYADWMIIRLEEKIGSIRQEYDSLKTELDQTLKDIPKQLSISESLSQHPANLPLYVGDTLGFQGIFLLTEFDELARSALQAAHIGTMLRERAERIIDRASTLLRSLYVLAQSFRNAGVTREDFRIGSARAIAAVEKYGEVPQDILEGKRRGKYAPTIVTKADTDSGKSESSDSEEIENGTASND